MNSVNLGFLLIVLFYNFTTHFASAFPDNKYIALPGKYEELHLVHEMKNPDWFPLEATSKIENRKWISSDFNGIISSKPVPNDTLIVQLDNFIQETDGKTGSSNTTNSRKDSSDNSNNQVWAISGITPNAAVILLFVLFTLIFLVLSFIAFIADRNKRRMNALLRVQNYSSMGHSSMN